MLDLASFHAHKENVRSARLFEITDDDLLVDKIGMLYDSFHKAASYKNVVASFEAAGAVFEPGPNGMPIVRFSIDFTTQIWHKNKTKKEKAEIREKRKGKGETETRIDLKDSSDLNIYSENKDIQKVVKKKLKIIDYSKCSDLFHRLLLVLVPLEKSEYEELREQNKELNEKEEMKKKKKKKREIVIARTKKVNFGLKTVVK